MEYHIRFSLARPVHSAIPEAFLQKYASLKQMCEGGSSKNEWISRAWLEKVDVPSLPLLNRMEGGIGGDSNITDRQIRFEAAGSNWYTHDDIVLNAYHASDRSSTWSVEDLLSLVVPLQDVLEEYLGDNALMSHVAVSRVNQQDQARLEAFRISMWKPLLLQLDWSTGPPMLDQLDNISAAELKAMYEGHPSYHI
jgi:hypothetical protein|tara:strand:+ start:1134 stop:1718 length:585 start_codon:yes stop_codon:yes gene_type:complete